MDRWRSETVHDQAVNWLWTRISGVMADGLTQTNKVARRERG